RSSPHQPCPCRSVPSNDELGTYDLDMDEWSLTLTPRLRALVELVAHDGHMSDAAAALDMPQSSMSRRIHGLEELLGVPLLIHDGRIVRMTPSAIDLADGVRGPLQALDLAVDEVTG